MSTLVVMVLVVLVALLIALDAAHIGARKGLVEGLADIGPAGWFVACLLLSCVAVPVYLLSREKIRKAAIRAGHRGGQVDEDDDDDRD